MCYIWAFYKKCFLAAWYLVSAGAILHRAVEQGCCCDLYDDREYTQSIMTKKTNSMVTVGDNCTENKRD